jgi:hypothetical protein
MTQSRRFALLALFMVALYAAIRLIDPLQRWAALKLGGDRVEHLIVAYLIVGLTLVAFPKVKLWIPALLLVGAGAAVELVQAIPGVVGGPQFGDVAANAAGALAATLPMWLARFRRA